MEKHEKLEKGDWKKIHNKLEREGYSKESADKIDGAIKAKLGKSENELKKDATVPPPAPPAPGPSGSPAAQAQASMRSAFGSAPIAKSEPIDKIKPDETAPSDKTAELKDPAKNPKEQAEGNNEAAGTTPTQVGQDGKNMPGFDEMKSALKLAKFIGHMHAKRQMKSATAPAEHKPVQQAVGPRAEQPQVTAQSKPTFSAKNNG